MPVYPVQSTQQAPPRSTRERKSKALALFQCHYFSKIGRYRPQSTTKFINKSIQSESNRLEAPKVPKSKRYFLAFPLGYIQPIHIFRPLLRDASPSNSKDALSDGTINIKRYSFSFEGKGLVSPVLRLSQLWIHRRPETIIVLYGL